MALSSRVHSTEPSSSGAWFLLVSTRPSASSVKASSSPSHTLSLSFVVSACLSTTPLALLQWGTFPSLSLTALRHTAQHIGLVRVSLPLDDNFLAVHQSVEHWKESPFHAFVSSVHPSHAVVPIHNMRRHAHDKMFCCKSKKCTIALELWGKSLAFQKRKSLRAKGFTHIASAHAM
eukprot:6455962-Amphidinium_carterae.2